MDNYQKIIEAIKTGKKITEAFDAKYYGPESGIVTDCSTVTGVEYNPDDEDYEFLKIRYANNSYDNAACLDEDALAEIIEHMK